MSQPPADPAPLDAAAQPDPGPAVADLDTIVSLSKRRGFIFPSSEIYGGINAVWDYGPLGVELKNNVKRAWWRAMVQERDDIVGLDAGILMHPQVWITSGHVGSFSDPLVECGTCHRRYRLDELPGAEDLSATELRDEIDHPAPRLAPAPPTRARSRRRAASTSCSRRTWAPWRRTLPSSTCDRRRRRAPTSTSSPCSSRAARRCPSASPRSASPSATRSAPATSSSACASSSRWRCSTSCGPERPPPRPSRSGCRRRRAWYERYGVEPARLRFREHASDELAHYAKKAIDVEYRFPFGWKELEGIHNRGDFDLGSHARASGENLEYFDPATEEHFIPWIVETAAGADRAAFTFLIDAYHEEQVRDETARRAAPPSGPGAVQGGRPAAAQEATRDRGALPPHQGRPQAGHDGRLRRHGRHRQALPAPGRDRHAVVRDGGRRLARGRRGDASATATA